MSLYFFSSQKFLCCFFSRPVCPTLQFAGVLDGVLSKLSRYDEGTFFSSILSFTVSPRLLLFHLLLILHHSPIVFLLPSAPSSSLYASSPVPASSSLSTTSLFYFSSFFFLLLLPTPLPLTVFSSSFSFFRAAGCLGQGAGTGPQRSKVQG